MKHYETIVQQSNYFNSGMAFSFSSSRGRFSMFIRGVSVFSTNFSDNSTFRSFLFQNEDRIDIPSQKGEKENI